MPKAKTTIMCEGVGEQIDKCDNGARYVTSSGVYLCGLCDAKRVNGASIRLSDIPALVYKLTELHDGLALAASFDHVILPHVASPAREAVAFISKRGVTFQ